MGTTATFSTCTSAASRSPNCLPHNPSTFSSEHTQKSCSSHVETFCDYNGQIVHVRIGRWRILAATGKRRIAEVHELSCKRIAVKIEIEDSANLAPSCTIWELYDFQGHLLCMLQYLRERDVWLATDFQTGHVTHVERPDSSHVVARA